MVLVTDRPQQLEPGNGLLAVVVNVGLDVLLIPRYGITGAAIGWSAAIVVDQPHAARPDSRGRAAASIRPRHVPGDALSAFSFGVLPWRHATLSAGACSLTRRYRLRLRRYGRGRVALSR